jgi:hypothetical protein
MRNRFELSQVVRVGFGPGRIALAGVSKIRPGDWGKIGAGWLARSPWNGCETSAVPEA